MRRVLKDAFETKVWRGSPAGYRSGPGSTLEATERLRQQFPALLDVLDVKTLLDAPCGDWFWMQHVDLSGVDYIGADISEGLVQTNRDRFARENVRFLHLDITSSPLPDADLMLCRDCLFHLKNRYRWAFFQNFAKSQISWLLMTMHHLDSNRPLGAVGNFAAFSPMAPPFDFPAPFAMLHETHDAIPADMSGVERPWHYKSLGLWSRDQVIAVVESKRNPPTDTED